MFKGLRKAGTHLGSPSLRTPEGVLPSPGSKVSTFPGGRSWRCPHLAIRVEGPVCPQPSRIFVCSPGRRDFERKTALPLQPGKWKRDPSAIRAAEHLGEMGRVGIGAGSF